MYDNYIDDFITSVFTYSNLSTRMTNAHNMIQPYVTGTYGEIADFTHLTSASAFDASLSATLNTVSTSISDAAAYTP